MTGGWLISYVALWLLFLAETVVLLSTLRGLGIVYGKLKLVTPQLHSAPSNLKAGQVLPDVTWRTLSGDARPLANLKGTRQALVLVSPTCGPCVQYLQRLNREAPDPQDETVARRVIVSLGDKDGTARLMAASGMGDETLVLLDSDRIVTQVWGIAATPVTVVVDEDLRVVRQIFSAAGTGDQGPQSSARRELVTIQSREMGANGN